jgi:alpha-aminoadipic semialdehyde synthase
MNEIGLDPGIDHLSAMKIIDEIKNNGGRIKSFVSWCGGLPAPEVSDVPLGYKFSWSPRGVLTAGSNEALYRMNKKFTHLHGKNLLRYHFPKVRLPLQGFALEGIANRNSLSYAETYNLGEVKYMDTMFRGTLRYQGYSDLMHCFKKLGFLDAQTKLTNIDNWVSLITLSLW